MKVSVVIPVFNRRTELERTLKSVSLQTERSMEVLIVDDGSTEDIQGLVKKINDDRIFYFRLPAKGNANVARNLGIKQAKGKYIAMMDSDDEWLPNHLELRIREIEEKRVDFIFGSIVANHGSTNREVISRPLKKGEHILNYVLSDGMAQTSTYFFKTSTVKQVNWDESLERHQDWDFIARYTKQFSYSPSFIVTTIVHWITGERKFEHFESRKKFIDLYRKEISPRNYNEYHKKVFVGIMKRDDVNESTKKHYKKEALRYKQLITLNDFLEMHDLSSSGKFYRLYLRLVFAFKIILKA